jgi:hypothetical protein
VDDPFGMHILDCACHLHSPKSDFWFGDIFSLLYHIHQRSIWAELQYYVGAFLIGKSTVKLDDIGVLHLGMNLELRLKLEKLDSAHHVDSLVLTFCSIFF